VVVGGGIAGLEALLALGDLAGDRISLTLLAPEPEFTYRPLSVEEPFSPQPAERRALAPVAEELGAKLVARALAGVRAADHRLDLDDGSELDYDVAVVCVGGIARPAYREGVTFQAPGQPLEIDAVLRRAAEHPAGRVAFVVPPGVTWALPAYELALLAARRVADLRLELELVVVTPEPGPLAMFGPIPSDAVAGVLRARGIRLVAAERATNLADGVLTLTPGGELIEASEVIALPAILGPRVPGLPADEAGFIPIDDHARVEGVEDVYAAGDGTNFPIKQGGLGTQQADAAAEHIAARFGAALEPAPFHPVLRGKLLTGDVSLNLSSDLAGGGGEGVASLDYLWWPPHKVSGRYLAAWLAGDEVHGDPEPPRQSLEVEVSLPREWHREPMALDPYAIAAAGEPAER
jgi:sulfide:quinone oxidoreductase